MGKFDPAVLLKKSRKFTFKGSRSSASIGFFELGAGTAELGVGSSYVPWSTWVIGLGLSAVPASFGGARDKWTLKTPEITLAEAFMSFNGTCVYAGIYGSIPLSATPVYGHLLVELKKLPSSTSREKAIRDVKAHKNANAFELSACWAFCGGGIAYESYNAGPATSFTTPQMAVGLTRVGFVGMEPLVLAANAVGGIRNHIEENAKESMALGDQTKLNVAEHLKKEKLEGRRKNPW